MSAGYLIDRYETVFAKPVLERIRIITFPSGEVMKISVDVHGLTCREAKRFISNVINISRGFCTIEIIHGYRHGTRIKDMLRNGFSNPNVKEIVADFRNYGITYLQPS